MYAGKFCGFKDCDLTKLTLPLWMRKSAKIVHPATVGTSLAMSVPKKAAACRDPTAGLTCQRHVPTWRRRKNGPDGTLAQCTCLKFVSGNYRWARGLCGPDKISG